MRIYKHHKHYTISSVDERPWCYQYSAGKIESVGMILGADLGETTVVVRYRTGETYTWKSKHFGSYIDQFGIAVSNDGAKVFAQTWEMGLFCLDAKTGERIWRTKSRRGITNIFVNDDTIAVQLHDYAMQLLDMNTGEVIKEKRPATAWGFTSLDNKYIICQVTAKRWEIIEAETLEVKESFTHKSFTDNHTDFCVNHISLCENGTICVRGFRNVWDDTVRPPKMLPNVEFAHYVKSQIFKEL